MSLFKLLNKYRFETFQKKKACLVKEAEVISKNDKKEEKVDSTSVKLQNFCYFKIRCLTIAERQLKITNK